MDMKNAIKFVGRQIDELERATYIFETVIKPRAEADKQILEKLRAQHLKLMALKEKSDRGESVTTEDIRDAVPDQFR